MLAIFLFFYIATFFHNKHKFFYNSDKSPMTFPLNIPAARFSSAGVREL